MKRDAQNNASTSVQAYLTLNSLSLILHTLRNRANTILDKAGIDLRVDQLPVFLLVCEKKMLCQQDIADTLSRDKSSVQRTITCLQRLHYVKVSTQPGDRRKRSISLTDQGKALFDKLRNDINEVQDSIFVPLPETEKRSLLHTLSALTKSI
ncbi:MarR family winged helix-turn-helix transcriptional regulator [Dyadobacter sp. OTU695]|uniref:MarR family winged helix-turn-helix transcriptional regulator n=1 Tax=Dyadobacter sp. OTU695 TaxID=3043860 RepID=UPI00313DAC33